MHAQSHHSFTLNFVLRLKDSMYDKNFIESITSALGSIFIYIHIYIYIILFTVLQISSIFADELLSIYIYAYYDLLVSGKIKCSFFFYLLSIRSNVCVIRLRKISTFPHCLDYTCTQLSIYYVMFWIRIVSLLV